MNYFPATRRQFLRSMTAGSMLLPGIVRGGPAAAKSAFNAVEEDVISALSNFGVSRTAAETAVTKARSAGEGNDFDGLFRRALKLVR